MALGSNDALALKVHNFLHEGRRHMICPLCARDEMAYSALSHTFICIDSDCEFELEVDPAEAQEILMEQTPEHILV